MLQRLEVGGVVIDEVNVRSLSDEDIAAANAFGNILRAEAHPDDPPRPLEVSIASFRNIPEFYTTNDFWARDTDGNIVATGEGGWMNTDENTHLVQCDISVHPDYRQRGIGKALLRLLVDVAEKADRTLIMGGSTERVPAGGAFCDRVGAERGMAVHTNRLLIADVDRDMVKRWIDEGPGRAPGYSLISIDGRYPDDLVEQIVDVEDVMNSAPRDDLQMEDSHTTVEQVRQMEVVWFARGDERWALFAQHDESGLLVGWTEVLWNASQPKTVYQLGTGVRPEHRGHALGKWLKAVLLQRIMDERPDVVDIRTGNADSNDPMLGINRQLGFKPYEAAIWWQAPVDRVRTYLAGE